MECLFSKEVIIAQTFSNLTQARDVLCALIGWIFSRINNRSRRPEQQGTNSCPITKARDFLWKWNLLLQGYTGTLHINPESSTAYNIRLLRLYHRLVTIIACTAAATTEMIYDDYTDDFRDILSEYQDLRNTYNRYRSDSFLSPPLRLDDLLSLPYLIAVHCREPSLRRTAITLLRTSQPDSSDPDKQPLAAKFAEKIMNIEERGLTLIQNCRDISEFSRIRVDGAQLLLTNDSDGAGKEDEVWLGFRRWPYGEEDFDKERVEDCPREDISTMVKAA